MRTAPMLAALLAAAAATAQPTYTEDFQSFTPAPLNQQQGWTSPAGDDALIAEDENLNRAARYERLVPANASDSRLSEWGLVGPPFPAAYGRLALDVLVTPGSGDRHDQHHIASEDPLTSFLNVRVALRASGAIAVHVPLLGAEEETASTFTPGEVFRLTIETTPGGVVRVEQDGAVIFEGVEFARAYLGPERAGKTGRVSAWSDTETPSAERPASSLTIDNIVFTPTACPGDFNADGAADAADLAALLARWEDPRPGGPADINADGAIDILDLSIFIAKWGDCPG